MDTPTIITMINTKNCKIDKNWLKIGKKIEMEHTNSKRVAERIASQHLCESPRYYKELIKLEKKLKI